ncbi:hypothetical protein L7F22_040255 [Adiantum nelumboides]|nr:hypothetical protein [Adiantum nelumboides]
MKNPIRRPSSTPTTGLEACFGISDHTTMHVTAVSSAVCVPLPTAAIFTATTVTTSQAPLGVVSSPMPVPVADTSHVSTPPEDELLIHLYQCHTFIPLAQRGYRPYGWTGQGIQGTQIQVPVGYTHPGGSTHFMRPSAHTSVGQPPYYAYYSQGFGTSAPLAHMQPTHSDPCDGIAGAHRHGCDGRHTGYTPGQTVPSAVQQAAVAVTGIQFDQSRD